MSSSCCLAKSLAVFTEPWILPDTKNPGSSASTLLSSGKQKEDNTAKPPHARTCEAGAFIYGSHLSEGSM